MYGDGERIKTAFCSVAMMRRTIGIPTGRPVEFGFDVIRGSAPVARTPVFWRHLSSKSYQLEVKEEDIHKTAFRARCGHCEFLARHFGLAAAKLHWWIYEPGRKKFRYGGFVEVELWSRLISNRFENCSEVVRGVDFDASRGRRGDEGVLRRVTFCFGGVVTWRSRVRAEHQKPYGKMQTVEVPMWNLSGKFSSEQLVDTFMREVVVGHEVPVSIISVRDARLAYQLWERWDTYLSLAEFPFTLSFHSSFRAQSYVMLAGGDAEPRSVGARGVLGSTEVIQRTTESIKRIMERLRTAHGRQRRRQVWASAFGLFAVFTRFGKAAYRLELLEVLEQTHSTFHVSQVRKCLADETAHMPSDDIQVEESLNYIERPVAVLERKVKTLRNKEIGIVKVQWQHRQGSGWTWEPESEMRKSYPELFSE
ncbi:hypothetical protein OSB04_029319 [Centaurea solstitialis]|uniref:Tf2-1-like SH3-like domain-containing protein n=1 Tax=Centaurea solstitialis TaxID=347529 RepID=A0AA38T263_9ASTR|nr:hypothetical protein OSB04_029319 [Centaurea solstitialis]